ncbi:MAG: HAMP domain-containing sensor histidine kinase [Actinomycetota bacterium]
MDTPFKTASTSHISRLVDHAFPPSYPDGPLAHVSTLALWLRPMFGVLSVAAGLAFSSIFPHQGTFLRIVGIVLLPYALATAALGRYKLAPTYRALTILGDLGVVFAIDYCVPETHLTALFGYALIVTYAASSTGTEVSSATAIGAIGLTSMANTRAGASHLDPQALVFFGVVLCAMVLLVNTSTRELRSQLTHQTRMQVSELSHELRTSLTAINGFAQTLIARWDDIDGPAGRFFLERITSNTSEMEQLVARILELSRIEEGAWVPQASNERLRPTVEALVQTLAPALADHSVVIDIDANTKARVDAFALRRVLGNLLTNAAKFSPPGASIEVRARPHPDHVDVTVADRGPGIPDSDRERIFDPYYRGSGERRTAGTGLGLLLARRYVEAEGGHIRVDPGTGGGSVFTVTLPTAESVPARAKKRHA